MIEDPILSIAVNFKLTMHTEHAPYPFKTLGTVATPRFVFSRAGTVRVVIGTGVLNGWAARLLGTKHDL